MSKLAKLYEDSLKLAFITVDHQGRLYQSYGDVPEPLMSADKPIYLSSANRIVTDEFHAYHPLAESMGQPEHAVAALIRRYYTKSTALRLVSLIGSVIAFSENVDQHPNANPEQSNMLRQLGVFEPNLGSTWTDLVRKVSAQPTLSIMNVYCRNGAKIAGREYLRGAIVTFGIYEMLKTWLGGGEKPAKLGVGSKKKAENIIRVFEYILPEITTESPEKAMGYSRGCSDPQGPRWVALMRSLGAIQERINSVAQELGAFCFEPDKIIVDLDWIPQLDTLGELRAEILSWNSSKSLAAPAPATAAPAAAPAARGGLQTRNAYASSAPPAPQLQVQAPPPPAPALEPAAAPAPNRVSIGARPSGLIQQQPGQYTAYQPPAPPPPAGAQYTYSPDGRHILLNGQWVPAPPQAPPQPQMTYSPDGRFVLYNGQWVPAPPQQQQQYPGQASHLPVRASLYPPAAPAYTNGYAPVQNPMANMPATAYAAAVNSGQYVPVGVSNNAIQQHQTINYAAPVNAFHGVGSV